jgi:hypothetical protein
MVFMDFVTIIIGLMETSFGGTFKLQNARDFPCVQMKTGHEFGMVEIQIFY